MAAIKKTNHFYVDESGGLNDNSNIFILGCLKTDTPIAVQEELDELTESILESSYFIDQHEKLEKQGFHATEDNFDIRAKLYQLMPRLNFRTYFALLDKGDVFFKHLREEKNEAAIYSWMVEKLIIERIKNNSDHNIVYFEELQLSGRSQKSVLQSIAEEKLQDANVEFRIVKKNEDVNMVLIDYMNYIFFSLFKDLKKQEPRMLSNFKLFEAKMALVIILNNNTYLNRQRIIDVKNINNVLAG